MKRITFCFVFFACLVAPGFVCAQSGSEPTRELALPPAPRELPPTLLGEVHFHVVMPIDSGALCPGNTACIFSRGGGVGGVLERRWPTGLALQLGYDLWLLDGNGVWELGIMQFLRAGIRYLFRQARRVHPYLGVGFGGLVLGESFKAESFGAGLQFETGIEVEISTSLALNFALTGRVFTESSFYTRNDGVERGAGFDLNGALMLQFGIAVFETP